MVDSYVDMTIGGMAPTSPGPHNIERPADNHEDDQDAGDAQGP
jgi:hypothetical protein